MKYVGITSARIIGAHLYSSDYPAYMQHDHAIYVYIQEENYVRI